MAKGILDMFKDLVVLIMSEPPASVDALDQRWSRDVLKSIDLYASRCFLGAWPDVML